MAGYLLRRLAAGVVVIWAVATGVFFFMHLRPGDPGAALLPRGTPTRMVHAFDALNGFDEPLYVQYGDFLRNLVLHGQIATAPSLTRSFVGARLADIVRGPLLHSLVLTAGCYLLALPASYLIARIGLHRSHYGSAIGLAGRIGYAVPSFLAGIVLYELFTYTIPLLPGNPVGWLGGDITAQPAALVLPIVTLAIGQIAFLAVLMRNQLLQAHGGDHVPTARAIGLSPNRVVRRHVVRNAAIPVVHAVPARIAGLLGTQAVVEIVFHYPGVGAAFVAAAKQRQQMFTLGTILLVSMIVVLGSLLADVCTSILDPRIRTAGH